MSDFKGDEYYNDKLNKVMEIFDDMDLSEAFTLITGISVTILENCEHDKDIEFARKLFDRLKSGSLDELSDRDWQ